MREHESAVGMPADEMRGPEPGQPDVFGATDIGKRRKSNEDHFVVASLHRSVAVRHTSVSRTQLAARLLGTDCYLLAVADGVGSLGGGELASGTAVEVLTEYLSHAANFGYVAEVEAEHEFLDHLERAVLRSHDTLQERFGDSRSGPATTLTLAMILGERAYIVHTGDSRCYVLNGDRLRQLTRDQTMAELLIDEGVMSEAEARDSGMDHVLSSAVGHDPLPTVALIDLDPGDILLLCTDGLLKHVSDPHITTILQREATAEAMVTKLIEAALDDGGGDNVTVVVAKM